MQIENRKVTMFGLSEFGFPVARQTTLMDIQNLGEYTKIIHRPKRKRRMFSKTVQPRQEVYIFGGWIEIDANMFRPGQSASLACFDERYIQIGLDSANQSPMFKIQGGKIEEIYK